MLDVLVPPGCCIHALTTALWEFGDGLSDSLSWLCRVKLRKLHCLLLCFLVHLSLCVQLRKGGLLFLPVVSLKLAC